MRLYLRPEERRPDPAPLATDDRRVVLVGTALWAALLAAAVIGRDGLVTADRGWWLWVCVAGVALGLLGLSYLHHRTVRGNPPR